MPNFMTDFAGKTQKYTVDTLDIVTFAAYHPQQSYGGWIRTVTTKADNDFDGKLNRTSE
jgi:hypothetical protein